MTVVMIALHQNLGSNRRKPTSGGHCTPKRTDLIILNVLGSKTAETTKARQASKAMKARKSINAPNKRPCNVDSSTSHHSSYTETFGFLWKVERGRRSKTQTYPNHQLQKPSILCLVPIAAGITAASACELRFQHMLAGSLSRNPDTYSGLGAFGYKPAAQHPEPKPGTPRHKTTLNPLNSIVATLQTYLWDFMGVSRPDPPPVGEKHVLSASSARAKKGKEAAHRLQSQNPKDAEKTPSTPEDYIQDVQVTFQGLLHANNIYYIQVPLLQAFGPLFSLFTFF